MTYCVGILVREGLVMIADTRTNAGIDNIATFRKLHLFEKPGEVVMAIATAGNLAVSQSVLTLVSEGMEDPETHEIAHHHGHAQHVQGGAVRRPRHPRGRIAPSASNSSRPCPARSTCPCCSAARSRAAGCACS